METTASQVRAQLPGSGYRFIRMDDVTLRVSFPSRGNGAATNVDIHYDRGSDLYDVDAYQIRGVQVNHVLHYEGVYADQLGNMISSARSWRDSRPKGQFMAYNEKSDIAVNWMGYAPTRGEMEARLKEYRAPDYVKPREI